MRRPCQRNTLNTMVFHSESTAETYRPRHSFAPVLRRLDLILLSTLYYLLSRPLVHDTTSLLLSLISRKLSQNLR
ncbi:hypothetical protein BDV11DRAFT_188756 [Aspergillus similis]